MIFWRQGSQTSTWKFLTATLKCICNDLSQMLWKLSVYCGCKRNWAASFWITLSISFQYQSKLHITTVSSVVCNQGNHSMVIIKTASLFLQLQGVWELKLTLHTLSHKIIAVSASHAEILSLVLHGYTYRKSNSLVLTTLGGQCLCLMPSLSYPTTHYDASGFYKPTDICLSSHFLVITTTCRWEQYS